MQFVIAIKKHLSFLIELITYKVLRYKYDKGAIEISPISKKEKEKKKKTKNRNIFMFNTLNVGS